MLVEDTQRNKAITTATNAATYVDAAWQGEQQWWQYLLGLVVILFWWLVIGSAASVLTASALIVFALGGQTDYAVPVPLGKFLMMMARFPFLLAGVLLTLSLIHRRHPRTLITAHKKINWHRVGQGFVAWFVPWCLVLGLGQYFLHPNTFSFNADLETFLLFVPLALVLTAIQSTTEELFFRGYVVQGASLIWANRIFLSLVLAVVFTLPHLLNPKAQAGEWITVFLNYFVPAGVLLTVVSLIDGTTELAIGTHFANNICNVLLVNATGTEFTTPALFKVSEYHATFGALSVLVIIPLFLAIAYGVFKRKSPQPNSQHHQMDRRWSHYS